MKKHIAPEFLKAFDHYKAMVKQYGEEHPIAIQAFMLAFELSPQHLKDEAYKMAEQHLPKPSGCLDNGQLVYNSKDLADHYDISFKQAETSLLNMMQQRKEHGLSADDVLSFALANMIR
ncbi:hypothetical protein [Acinetobacter indicus]|uniref:hypothetical protein n=1 Tax=Acinetobacter indicus TaxID=756892 RepID=UPI001443A8A5|nr:hypothetical protein [Acinetobacter indicus]